MESDKKVFCSDITRIDFKENNNLYELLNVTPVKPIPAKNSEDEVLLRNFEPISDKYYVPKKISRLKVRTVREIRNQFEQDNYSFIIEDMEKQQNTLLAKIRTGSARDNNTKNMAKKLLNANHPISRTAWQMLNNINPEKHVNPTQFVLWDGRRIRVTGSKGGRNRFICNYDLGKKIGECKRDYRLDRNEKRRRSNGLLRNSLNIKFKPGPLRKKKYLDDSYQKYHMGSVELPKLPKPALEIRPSRGTVLEPVITSFLNNIRAEDGTITQQWAEFAVSVVGTVQNKGIVDIEKQPWVTFDLSYNCDQNSILMRRDIAPPCREQATNSNANFLNETQNSSEIMAEVKNIMDDILTSVEISLKQDCLFSLEDELSLPSSEQSEEISANDVRDKNKRKYCELDRLDVTIIKLPGTPMKIHPNACEKSYCSLGCLCDSLECIYKFKQHCGLFDCMLGCKCEFSKYRDIEQLENSSSGLISGLIKLETEINCKLAKEEQKFHQTVVVSGEKRILLKSRKRNLKSSKKYAEFYSHMRLKTTQEPKKILTVVDKKLNCINIEPWCMVHNLYKCFCKGRFLEACATTAITPPTTTDQEINITCDDDKIGQSEENINLMLRPQYVRNNRDHSILESKISFSSSESGGRNTTCARATEYLGRKYEDGYYKITNNKILEMEKHDTMLHKKMMMLYTRTTGTPLKPTIKLSNLSENSDNHINVCDERQDKEITKKNVKMQSISNLNKRTVQPYPKSSGEAKPVLSDKSKDSNTTAIVPSKSSVRFDTINGDFDEATRTKIIANAFPKSMEILRESYLKGKKITLEGPTKGKVIIHSWEFVLSRYRSKRNIFMVTKDMRHRIFMAVDSKHPFFENCLNIDTIRFADLYQYPFVVRYLLTNATAKEHFCILLGWEFCWEIVASGKKNGCGFERGALLDTTAGAVQQNSANNDSMDMKLDDNIMINDPIGNILYDDSKSEPDTNKSERSKWFIMAIENDFSEIHCHKAGFYVKREQIIEAIKLARFTGKTVVINKAKEGIEFGFYAMSNSSQYCIIVGPYGTDEPLGFEAIVYTSSSKTQKTVKGYWLTTNKVDNEKVLNDPQSFIPSKGMQIDSSQMITIQSKPNLNVSDDTNVQPSTSHEEKNPENHDTVNKDATVKPVKIVKPIKIRRTNGFYHLTPQKNVIRNFSTNAGNSFVKVKQFSLKKSPITINDPQSLLNITNYSDVQIMNSAEEDNATTKYSDHEMDVPQIKITSVYSESIQEQDNQKIDLKKPGMFVLKPEEINNKLPDVNYKTNDLASEMAETSMSMDIESFLSQRVDTSENGVLLISDEEDSDGDTQSWEYVSIQCSNIRNLGWIRGKRNKNNLLSIDMTGFRHIQRFEESDALSEINWVLSSKVRIPEHIKLEWQVLTLTDKYILGPELNLRDLTKNHVITENGIQKLSKLKKKGRSDTELRRAYFSAAPRSKMFGDKAGNEKASDFIDELEETSRILDDESTALWNETENRSSEIIQTIIVPEEYRMEMTETLEGLITLNDNLLDD